MSEPEDLHDTNEPVIDWDQARAFLSRRLARRLMREDHSTLEDLTQEAAVRLRRATRRSAVGNLEGLMETIAQRTIVDFLRRRRPWELPEAGVDAHDNPDLPGLGRPPQDETSLDLDRLRFTVLEFFEARNSKCLELARYYFLERSWVEVARTLGRPYTAITKQWSRCVEVLRDAARSSAGDEWDWA